MADAARGLRGVGSAFSGTGAVAQRAAASVSWQGQASAAFQARCADYAASGEEAQTACAQAASVLSRFADRLADGREKVKGLQDRASECLQRIKELESAAAEAADREQAGRPRPVWPPPTTACAPTT